MTDLGPTCRHFNGRISLVQFKGCAIGHPIERIVKGAMAAKGLRGGMAYRLPCQPGPMRIAECPNYDPKTAEESAADQAKSEEDMRRFVAGLPAVNAIRKDMTANGLTATVRDCPWCGAAAALHVGRAEVNNHLRATCTECKMGFIE